MRMGAPVGRHVGGVDDQEVVVHDADVRVSVVVDGIRREPEVGKDSAARVGVVSRVEGISDVSNDIVLRYIQKQNGPKEATNR